MTIAASNIRNNELGVLEHLIPKQKKVLNTTRKRNTIMFQILWFPIAYLIGAVPYAPSPIGVPEFTPAIAMILQIGTLIIALSTGFTSVAFYNEKRLKNQISDAVQIQAIEMKHIRDALDDFKRDFDSNVKDKINSSAEAVNGKISGIDTRLRTVEEIFWNKRGGNKNG